MLTGDHPFTAMSIGHSCGLIESGYHVVMLNKPSFEEVRNKLLDINELDDNVKLCIVVTGDILSIILNKKESSVYNLFLSAVRKALCVICSRVSPKQKADLVLLVKSQEMNITTLAIGDGANDVNMITAADIGIGIMGNEGQQAARASDYVIGQFSYLRRLMFVHGRESYRKNSFAVGYILWKNSLYAIPQMM
jgi:phospholipid-transporting ATPase